MYSIFTDEAYTRTTDKKGNIIYKSKNPKSVIIGGVFIHLTGDLLYEFRDGRKQRRKYRGYICLRVPTIKNMYTVDYSETKKITYKDILRHHVLLIKSVDTLGAEELTEPPDGVDEFDEDEYIKELAGI